MQSSGKWMLIVSAALLVLLGVLQNPQPTGFETRPSSEIPAYFFAFFAAAAVSAIATVVLALWRMKWAVRLVPLAAFLNVIPPIADNLHLLHTSPTPGAMLAVEVLAIADSILLLYLGYLGRRL